ncbi:hypothetical protein [Miltoncostaea marina]|uniref:hypothetical protein n=1 Tax=Miltoncostaea marina TaxID=2843215 RepID=UPI001C3DE6BC|nr:hypothetical protein [Miltoncostaea marina]
MSAAPEGWAELVGGLEQHVSPEWSRHAHEHGGQGWIRLILLVDAHHQLSTPRVAEKVAMTMADLAADREGERAGWEAVRVKAEAERMELVARVVDSSETLLPDELLPLFVRSIEPTPPGM